MITKRIIPCLDVKDGRVVKGVNFGGLADVSSPVELAKYYSANGADELVFYDITASAEGRALFTDILTETAKSVFIPLTVGGGINTLADFDRVLKCGADKVSVNSGAIRNPSLIYEAAKRYGDQCVVLSADVKRVDGVFRVFAKGGRENTGMEAIEWIRRGVDSGAGEIVLNSIDTDGVKGGFDLEMLEAVCNAVSVPVIASGGAGCIEHFITLFNKCIIIKPQSLRNRLQQIARYMRVSYIRTKEDKEFYAMDTCVRGDFLLIGKQVNVNAWNKNSRRYDDMTESERIAVVKRIELAGICSYIPIELSQFVNTEKLSIRSVWSIDNLSFVSKYKNLEYLNLKDTAVSNISAISSCRRLAHVEFCKNPIDDYSVLYDLAELKELLIDDLSKVDVDRLKTIYPGIVIRSIDCNGRKYDV